MDQWLETLDKPYSFHPIGSSLKFCRIAQGAYDMYPRFSRTCQWDTAAGQAIVEKTGGTVTDLSGKPLRYGVLRDRTNPNFICQIVNKQG